MMKKKLSFEGARPKKGLNIFEYFPNNSSSFYPNGKPNTTYEKKIFPK